jgi:hypothetical protein
MGLPKVTRPRPIRARERALGVTEQLGLGQLVRDRCAVDAHVLAFALAPRMERACDTLLARAGLAFEDQGQAALDDLAHRLERRAQLVATEQARRDLIEWGGVVHDAGDHHADPLAQAHHVALAERGGRLDRPPIDRHPVAAAQIANRERRADRRDLGVLARDLGARQHRLTGIGTADDVPALG